jgi:DNA-binding MarR family transcriptional regulator
MFDVNAVAVYLLGRKLMKIAESAFVADQQHGGGLPTSVRMVLVDISVHPGSSIGEITARTGFPQSHVSASVARLREAGVLETSVDPGDGRRTLVGLAAGFGERLGRRAPVPVDAALAAEIPSTDPECLAQTIEALEVLAERIIPQALLRTRATPTAGIEVG